MQGRYQIVILADARPANIALVARNLEIAGIELYLVSGEFELLVEPEFLRLLFQPAAADFHREVGKIGIAGFGERALQRQSAMRTARAGNLLPLDDALARAFVGEVNSLLHRRGSRDDLHDRPRRIAAHGRPVYQAGIHRLLLAQGCGIEGRDGNVCQNLPRLVVEDDDAPRHRIHIVVDIFRKLGIRRQRNIVALALLARQQILDALDEILIHAIEVFGEPRLHAFGRDARRVAHDMRERPALIHFLMVAARRPVGPSQPDALCIVDRAARDILICLLNSGVIGRGIPLISIDNDRIAQIYDEHAEQRYKNAQRDAHISLEFIDVSQSASSFSQFLLGFLPGKRPRLTAPLLRASQPRSPFLRLYGRAKPKPNRPLSPRVPHFLFPAALQSRVAKRFHRPFRPALPHPSARF